MGVLPLLVSLLATSGVQAQEIGTERTLGIGVQLGSPTGVSGKYYFMGPEHAVSAAIATEFIGFADDRLTIYATYLYHPLVLASGTVAELPLFVGIGPQFWTSDLGNGNDDFDDDAAFGARIPVGLDVNLRELPLQFSAELAGLLPFVPEVDFSIDLSVAARYYF